MTKRKLHQPSTNFYKGNKARWKIGKLKNNILTKVESITCKNTLKKTSQSLISANKSKLMPKCSNMMVMGYMSPIFPTKEVPFLKS